MTNTTRRGFLGWLGAALVLRKATFPAPPQTVSPAIQRLASVMVTHARNTDALNRAWRNAQAKLLEGFQAETRWKDVRRDA